MIPLSCNNGQIRLLNLLPAKSVVVRHLLVTFLFQSFFLAAWLSSFISLSSVLAVSLHFISFEMGEGEVVYCLFQFKDTKVLGIGSIYSIRIPRGFNTRSIPENLKLLVHGSRSRRQI